MNRILVADDDKDDQLLLYSAFNDFGRADMLVTVNNGVELLETLTKEGAILPSLILLDLNMPRMGGMETLAVIKTDIRLKHIHIQGWLKKLRKDKRLIFHASAQAQKAVDYILNHPEESSPTTQTENTRQTAIRHMKVYYQYTGGSYDMPKPMNSSYGKLPSRMRFRSWR